MRNVRGGFQLSWQEAIALLGILGSIFGWGMRNEARFTRIETLLEERKDMQAQAAKDVLDLATQLKADNEKRWAEIEHRELLLEAKQK